MQRKDRQDIMANCSTCGNKFAFFEAMKNLIGPKRCDQCLAKFGQSSQYWLGLMQQQFDQGGIAADLEQAIYRNFQEINMPSDIGQPVIQRFQYLRNLSEIRRGNLPVIRTHHILDSDEIARFEMPATWHKPNKNVKLVPGQLLGSNKKLYFHSQSGADSVVIDWNNVSSVQEKLIIENLTRKVKSGGRTINQPYQTREHGIHLQVSKGSGGGDYVVADPFYTRVIIETLVRMWKRQLVAYKEQAPEGAIPEHVKAAVHHRDKGTCRQCGYQGPYIEYDHIIPRSKGGPNTVDNVQILCGQCNRKKGNRV
jgi:hypothetical protein